MTGKPMTQSDIGIVEKLHNLSSGLRYDHSLAIAEDAETTDEAAAIITEMVEALEAFVDAWDSVDHPFQPQMPQLYAQAKATLAKASGK